MKSIMQPRALIITALKNQIFAESQIVAGKPSVRKVAL